MTRSSATQTIAAAEAIRRKDKPLALDENAEPMAVVLRGMGTKGMIGRESREVTSSAVLFCGMAGSFL